MDVSKIVAEIDAKIASLQQARAVLVGLEGTDVTEKRRRGRPKGSTNKSKPAKSAKRKRNLSPEGRKRIAEAMKKRWAERRTEPDAKPVTPKPVTPKPATPKPATPKPATPKPATPKPAKK